MNKKALLIVAAIIAVVAVGAGFFWNDLKGVWPIVKPAPEPTPQAQNGQNSGDAQFVNTTGMPLKLPNGFSIEIFARDLAGARVMKFDPFGNIWVSQTSEGQISLVEIRDGKVQRHDPIIRDLKNPHGLAFDPDNNFALYFAEENKISVLPVYSDGPISKIIDLPSGGRHFTRTIGFGPDKRLYVSIGSSCDVCNESDNQRAKIFSMNKNGSDFKEFARGLRNSVFFVWDKAGKMLATEMGRDNLGDNLPPDEINRIEQGKNYGWPVCYGKNVHDSVFDKNTYVRNPCLEPFETQSLIDIPAHSAPLGLAFVSTSSWPADFQNNLIVAYHGSWNRTEPTGYKLVRMKFDSSGNYLGTEDFITGWLDNSNVYGRPVDVVFGPDNALYVSDDRAGVIYRITYSQ